MYEELNKRQLKTLNFITETIKSKGYAPSIREICNAVDINSTSTIHRYLKLLEEKGYIKKDPSKTRSIVLVDDDDSSNDISKNKEMITIPIIGEVAAGEPTLAVENIIDTITLPIDFIKNSKNDLFVLEVKGSSMIKAGIFEGDYIIVSKQNTAKNGDIVVALIDDGATVKRFSKEKNHILLSPENDEMEPIKVRKPIILGVVTGLYRKNIF